MAKACSDSMFSNYEFSGKADQASSKEALTYALLETVRLVLEAQESDDDKQALTDAQGSQSDRTSSGAYTDPPPRPAAAKKPASKGSVLGGPCAHCGATESPQWRRPLTKKVVLCNACGIYYSRHHSLPKRKKLPGLRHTTLEDIESKVEDSGTEMESDLRGSQRGVRASTPMSDAMACDMQAPVRGPSHLNPASVMHQDCVMKEAPPHLKPIVTHRQQPESVCSAESVQREEELKVQTSNVHAHLHVAPMAAASSPKAANSVSMACMSPAASCGSPMHVNSGIAAPPTTPKKRTDDQIDALFDANETSLAKRAMKRAAAMTAAAASQAAAATSSAPAVTAASTGTSTPVEQAIDPSTANFYVAPLMGGNRRPLLTASLAASVGMQLPPSMQPHQQSQQQQQPAQPLQQQQQPAQPLQQQQQGPGMAPGHMPLHQHMSMPMHPQPPHMAMPRMTLLNALMHQQSQARMAAAAGAGAPIGNPAAVHAFSALPGILMTTGLAAYHPQPQPVFNSHLRPVTTAISEQSGDSDSGTVLLPASSCRGPAPRAPASNHQGLPVPGSRY